MCFKWEDKLILHQYSEECYWWQYFLLLVCLFVCLSIYVKATDFHPTCWKGVKWDICTCWIKAGWAFKVSLFICAGESSWLAEKQQKRTLKLKLPPALKDNETSDDSPPTQTSDTAGARGEAGLWSPGAHSSHTARSCGQKGSSKWPFNCNDELWESRWVGQSRLSSGGAYYHLDGFYRNGQGFGSFGYFRG